MVEGGEGGTARVRCKPAQSLSLHLKAILHSFLLFFQENGAEDEHVFVAALLLHTKIGGKADAVW